SLSPSAPRVPLPLPAFPTRRSSDLGAVPGPGGLAPPTAGKASSCDDAVAQTAEPLRLPAVLIVTGILEHEQAQPLRGPTIAGSHRREALVRPRVSRRRARRASRLPGCCVACL